MHVSSSKVKLVTRSPGQAHLGMFITDQECSVWKLYAIDDNIVKPVTVWEIERLPYYPHWIYPTHAQSPRKIAFGKCPPIGGGCCDHDDDDEGLFLIWARCKRDISRPRGQATIVWCQKNTFFRFTRSNCQNN